MILLYWVAIRQQQPSFNLTRDKTDLMSTVFPFQSLKFDPMLEAFKRNPQCKKPNSSERSSELKHEYSAMS